MTRTLADDQLRLLRMRAQGLLHRQSRPIRAVVRDAGGIQAQDANAAALAVRVRTAEATASDVAREIRRGEVVRTWCMRGTLHLVDRTDLPWMRQLLSPGAIGRSRRRREQLGLDEELLERGRAELDRVLADGEAVTRDEVAARLARRDIRLEGQALYHFLRHMGLEGILRLGPIRDGDQTYTLLERVGRPSSASPPDALLDDAVLDDAPLEELARRYLGAHGPATRDGFARWAGLGKREAGNGWAGIEEQTVEFRLGDRRVRMLEEQAAWLEEAGVRRGTPVVHLVPGYDPYLLGYRSRDFAVASEHAKRIHPGGGFLRPAVLADGRVVGTWKRDGGGDRTTIRVEGFTSLDAAVRGGLEKEVADLGRFLGTKASLHVEEAS